MKVQDVMSSEVRTVSPNARADEAWKRMRNLGVHHLVVTEQGTICGIVSDRDLGGRRGHTLRAGRKVRDVMTENPIQARADASVRQAANLLRGRSIGCLPVVGTGGRLVGIVTTSDLLRLLGNATFAERKARRKVARDRAAPRRNGRK